MSQEILDIKNLEIFYKTKHEFFEGEKLIHAVNNLSLNIKKGEILSIAGESGCGKSTLAKAIMKLIPINSGEIKLYDKDLSEICSKDFYNKVQMIFQNPYSSLNPKMKIRQILEEPLLINTNLKKEDISKIILEKIDEVGLDESCLGRYPHEFSGGQRQRIAITRALILNPEFIVADEPVSALDVSIQAQIINLLKDLKSKFNLTFLFISHDLSVIRYLSDRIAIMYLGEIVEIGTTNEIFNNPKHPYTKTLLNSAPTLDYKNKKEKISLLGELPSPENIPKGCKFHTRCPYVMDVCKTKYPENLAISETHSCKCFLNENLSVI